MSEEIIPFGEGAGGQALAGTTPALAEQERVLENVYQRVLTAYRDAGAALQRIRDERLYKEVAPTFEDYCQKRWGFSRQRAYQLIGATEMSTRLTAGSGDSVPIPRSERAARALATVPERERAAVMRAVGPDATAREIAETARAFRKQGSPEPGERDERDEPVPTGSQVRGGQPERRAVSGFAPGRDGGGGSETAFHRVEFPVYRADAPWAVAMRLDTWLEGIEEQAADGDMRWLAGQVRRALSVIRRGMDQQGAGDE